MAAARADLDHTRSMSASLTIDVRRTALLAISIAIPIPIWTLPTQDWSPGRDLFYRCHYNLQAR